MKEYLKHLSLKEELKKRGWELVRITKFKHHDRIVIRNDQLKVSANLRGKQKEYSLQEIVNALTRNQAK